MSGVATAVAIGAVSANVQANKAKGAAKGAANTQADAGREAQEYLEQSSQKALGLLDPRTARDDLTGGFGMSLAALQGANRDAQGFLTQGAESAQGFISPYAQLGQQGLDNSAILTDPNAQFDFLQNNPLFQSALDNANQSTLGMAAARGRLSSGDTLSALSGNTLLAAQPLLAQQQNNVSSLLNFGSGIAGQQANIASGLAGNQANLATGSGQQEAGLRTNFGQNMANIQQASQQAQANAALGTGTQVANLTTDIGAALAAGQVGAANVGTDLNNSLLQLGGQLGGAYLGRQT